MLAAVTLTGQRDFIFPEGAALTFGVLVMADPEWSASRWCLVVLPTGGAVLGHLLADSSVPVWLAEITGLSGAFVALQAFGSRVAPVLSAAVLPIVFGVHSWIYPAVVLVTCLVLAAAFAVSVRGTAARDVTAARPTEPSPRFVAEGHRGPRHAARPGAGHLPDRPRRPLRGAVDAEGVDLARSRVPVRRDGGPEAEPPVLAARG